MALLAVLLFGRLIGGVVDLLYGMLRLLRTLSGRSFRVSYGTEPSSMELGFRSEPYPEG